MREFRQRQKLKRILYSWPVIIILLVILLFVMNGTLKAFQKSRVSKEALLDSNTKKEELLKKQSNLQADISHLKTESGMEEAMRVQFNVAKEGEKTVVIIDEEEEEIVVPEKESFWQRITSLFQNL